MAREAQTAGNAADIVAPVDTGALDLANWQGRVVLGIAFIWGIFQLYIASNLPF